MEDDANKILVPKLYKNSEDSEDNNNSGKKVKGFTKFILAVRVVLLALLFYFTGMGKNIVRNLAKNHTPPPHKRVINPTILRAYCRFQLTDMKTTKTALVLKSQEYSWA